MTQIKSMREGSGSMASGRTHGAFRSHMVTGALALRSPAFPRRIRFFFPDQIFSARHKQMVWQALHRVHVVREGRGRCASQPEPVRDKSLRLAQTCTEIANDIVRFFSAVHKNRTIYYPAFLPGSRQIGSSSFR